MTTRASASIAFAVSLGLMLGVPLTVAKADDLESANAQSAKHKKPVANSGNRGSSANNPNGGTQTKGKDGTRYAKTGNCSGCDPTRLPYDPGKRPPPRAKTTLPKGWASPDNCKYVMPDDHDSAGHSLWESEKTACNQAGYPTPWSDKETSRTPVATPTPDDRSLGEKIRDGIDISGHLQSEHDKAHGLQATPCPSDTSAAQDAASGCHE